MERKKHLKFIAVKNPRLTNYRGREHLNRNKIKSPTSMTFP